MFTITDAVEEVEAILLHLDELDDLLDGLELDWMVYAKVRSVGTQLGLLRAFLREDVRAGVGT